MASEKRLIDANALQLEPDPWGGMNGVICLGRSGGKTMATVQAALRSMIDNAPTVDAVEVVRCKDCKHWHEETGWCDQHSWFIEEDGEPCHPWESNNWKMLNEDDFCSYGERKDNERKAD